MNAKKIAFVAGAFAVVYAVASHAVLYLFRAIPGANTAGLRVDGEAGWAEIALSTLAGVADTLLLVGLGLALGYTVARDLDLSRTYPTFLLAVGGGAAVAVVASRIVELIVRDNWGYLDHGAILGILVWEVFEIALVLTVCAFAGAALVQFRTDGDDLRTDARPADADGGEFGVEG